MKNRQEQLVERASAVRAQATSDPLQYISFLQFTAHMYKQTVENMLAIYSQQPSATAVASFDFWRKKGLYVRHKEEGIRVFDNNKQNGIYAGMFDIAQLRGDLSRYAALQWEYSTEYESLVANLLDIQADRLNSTEIAGNFLDELIQTGVDFSEQVEYNLENDFKDDSKTQLLTKQLIAYSAAYVVASRLQLGGAQNLERSITTRFLKLNSQMRSLSLEEALPFAAEKLQAIERSIRDERKHSNSRRENTGASSREYGEGGGRSNSTSLHQGERTGIPTGATARWDTDLRHGGRPTPRGGRESGQAVQQDIFSLLRDTELPQANTVTAVSGLGSTSDRDRRVLQPDLRQSQISPREAMAAGAGRAQRLRGASEDAKLDTGHGRRTDLPRDVEAIHPIEPKEDDDLSSSFFIGDTVEIQGKQYLLTQLRREDDMLSFSDLDFLKARKTPLYGVMVLSEAEAQLGGRIFENREEISTPTLSQLLTDQKEAPPELAPPPPFIQTS